VLAKMVAAACGYNEDELRAAWLKLLDDPAATPLLAGQTEPDPLTFTWSSTAVEFHAIKEGTNLVIVIREFKGDIDNIEALEKLVVELFYKALDYDGRGRLKLEVLIAAADREPEHI
jgi:hypothetical protein